MTYHFKPIKFAKIEGDDFDTDVGRGGLLLYC